jgi:hypothetical protein
MYALQLRCGLRCDFFVPADADFLAMLAVAF